MTIPAHSASQFSLQLYVNGRSYVSDEAVDALTAICQEAIPNQYQLEVIDIQQHPDRAEEAGIIAIPTLIRSWPLPVTRLIGALSIKSRVMAGLGIASPERKVVG